MCDRVSEAASSIRKVIDFTRVIFGFGPSHHRPVHSTLTYLVSTPLAFKRRWKFVPCFGGTRASSAPRKNKVGVLICGSIKESLKDKENNTRAHGTWSFSWNVNSIPRVTFWVDNERRNSIPSYPVHKWKKIVIFHVWRYLFSQWCKSVSSTPVYIINQFSPWTIVTEAIITAAKWK